MKTIKLILITAIAILFLSCSNDDCTPPQECGCNGWVREAEGLPRTVIPVELDCETGQPINLPEGYTFLGCDNDNTP